MGPKTPLIDPSPLSNSYSKKSFENVDDGQVDDGGYHPISYTGALGSGKLKTRTFADGIFFQRYVFVTDAFLGSLC